MSRISKILQNSEKLLCSREVYAPADGYITHMDSEKIGLTAVLLGAGREKKG